jgi:hypothetical protein
MLPLLGSFTSSAVCILVRVMYSHNASTIVRRVYDTVNMVFWALAIGTVVFLFLLIPQMREARAIAEAQRVQDIARENKRYCEKWGMQTGTHEHLICTMDLDAIRAEVEQRIADDNF